MPDPCYVQLFRLHNIPDYTHPMPLKDLNLCNNIFISSSKKFGDLFGALLQL